MKQIFKDSCIRYFIGDVRDQPRTEEAIEDVNYVIHCNCNETSTSC